MNEETLDTLYFNLSELGIDLWKLKRPERTRDDSSLRRRSARRDGVLPLSDPVRCTQKDKNLLKPEGGGAPLVEAGDPREESPGGGQPPGSWSA